MQLIYPEIVSAYFTANSGEAIPVNNALYIVGGDGITTSASGNTLTIASSGGGIGWIVVTSAMNPITLVPESGYIVKGASTVQFILPAAASIGDTFYIKGYGNLWTLSQNAFQFITLGVATTTAGAGGNLTATQIKDSVELLCVTANTEFDIITSVGNPTFT